MSTLLRPTKSSTMRATPTRSAVTRPKVKASTVRPLGERDLNRADQLSAQKEKTRISLSTDTFTPPTPPATPKETVPARPVTEQDPEIRESELAAAHVRIAALEAEVARLREELARDQRIASEKEGEGEGEAEEAEEAEETEETEEDGLRPGARVFAHKAAGLQADIDEAWDALASPASYNPPRTPRPKPRPARARIALHAALADAHFKNRGLALCLEDAEERAVRAEATVKRLRAKVARMAEENAGLVGAWARSVRAI
jgi:hypothetical protein